MNKAIFFDRDGTINLDEKGHTYRIEDLELIPNTIGGLKKLVGKGYLFFIITNQSGIGRKYYSEKDMHKFNNYLLDILKFKGIEFSKVYFCPPMPEDWYACRKPNPGMILFAEKEFNLNLPECFLIGDNLTDIVAGNIAKCKTIKVLTGKYRQEIKEADYTANNLLDAANFIIGRIKSNKNL